jgi:beta-glucosidase
VTGLNSAANQALALRAAEEGVVLLKNSRNILPLPTGKSLKIAVIGPNAHGSPDNLDSVRKNYLGS